jgi:hypothetical protein
MTRRTLRRALTLILATSVALPAASPAAHADSRHTDPHHTDPRPAAIDAWQESSTVRLTADGSLSDVLALSTGDVWAVGQQQIWDVWKNRGTIRHWNGERWSEVAIRDSTGAGNLRAVSASAGQVWAAGDGHDGLPYLARGDVNGFDRVRPEGLRSGDWLGGVYAGGERVVAVGSRDDNGLIVGWHEGEWTFQVTKEEGALYAVAGAFAVGDTGTAPLIMHHTGDTWKSMPVPHIPGGYLRDIQVDSGKRALAVGGVYRGPGKVEPLALAWNGKRWRQLPLPIRSVRLYGVTGDGKGHYWISGYDPARAAEPFILRCDKRSCEVIRGGEVEGRSSVRLQAVTYLAGKQAVWAVGHAVDARERYTDVVESFGPGVPEPAKS